MVEAVEDRSIVKDVGQLRTPLGELKGQLLLNQVHPGCDASCEVCFDNPEKCNSLKSGIQVLINDGVLLVEHSSPLENVATLEIAYESVKFPLEIHYDPIHASTITNPIVPLVIYIPTPLPFQSTKAIPWNYDSSVCINGQMVEDEPAKPSDASNITRDGGITRSGRIFAFQPLYTANNRALITRDTNR